MSRISRQTVLMAVSFCLFAVLPATAWSADTAMMTDVAVEIGHSPPDPHSMLAARRGGIDDDIDGVPNFADNCSAVANADQRDTNSDGFGNACDPDLNNDGVVNFLDLLEMRAAFFSTPTSPAWNPDADLNGDSNVNFLDLLVTRSHFFGPPGPSGMSCAGTISCPLPQLIFDWPMPGNDASDWVINNYVDLASGPAIVDYNGGSKSYNGHQGVDVDVSSFREMDNDFPVLAAAQGTVLALEDGNFDRNTSCIGSWNFVTIGHPNGWKSIYGHLKINSVVVSVGQVVEAGDTLGVVGSSGCSTQPHLHLETLDENGSVVSPFLEGMWSDPPAYNTPFGFMDAMIYNSGVSNIGMIKDPPPNATIVPPGGTLGTGLSMAGGGPGDVINFRVVNNIGTQIGTFNINFAQVYRHTYWWFNYPFSTSASGPHQVQIRLNGNLVRTHDFTVAPILSGFQQVRHGVPAANYQALFDDLVVNGYRPIWVDGYDVNGATFLNVIFDQSTVNSWAAAHGQNDAQYQDFFNAQVAAGRRLLHIDSYLQNGQIRHASVFVDQAGTQWAAYHSATLATHQAQFNSLVGQGFRAKIISTVQVAGTQRFTALYDKNPVGSWLALANLSSAQYQAEFNNQVSAGRVLAYLNGYTLNGSPVFSAIWNSVVPPNWVARHDLSAAQFQSEFDNWTGNFGYNTRIVTGYQNGGVANFGGLWSD